MILPIKKQWFDLIKSGKKKEEYRDLSYYYAARFANMVKQNQKHDDESIQIFIDECRSGKYRHGNEFPVVIRNGYSAASPTLTMYCNLSVGTGKEEWGAVHGEEYFVLHVNRIED